MIGYYKSPLGYISYQYDDHVISHMSFINEKPHVYKYNEMINNELENYFLGKQKTFTFTFTFEGFTEFQKDVFHAMLLIPFGQTKSYAEIAQMIGRPKAYRAVGQACKRNPIGIMVPCHRVIGSDHSLTGYSGKDYIYLKKKLLELENKYL